MNIEIDTIRIVSSGNVTGSAIASTIGLVGLPLLLLNTDADFVIFFWVTPMNYTKMTVSLSTNINKSKLDKIPMAATSSGYFANYEKRTIRQSKAFEDFLYHLLMQMEYKYDLRRQ
ncbi:MAG: hypothetical protein KDD36_02790 [Flavobacteriales bacterium]|nr:hypothetical protein [Flavobacteriales bacterium]